MGRTERSDLRSWTNCHSCRRRARIRRASVPLVAERSLIGMRERVIAPIILILTLRGPRRQAGPVIPNSGDVRGRMRGRVALRDGLSRQPVLGWAEFTGFLPIAWRGKGASCVLRTTTVSADEGIHEAAADSRRRPEHAYAGGAGPVRASQARKSPIGAAAAELGGPRTYLSAAT